MSTEARIRTIEGFIKGEELILSDMRKKVALYYKAIISLEAEIKAGRAKLKELKGD